MPGRTSPGGILSTIQVGKLTAIVSSKAMSDVLIDPTFGEIASHLPLYALSNAHAICLRYASRLNDSRPITTTLSSVALEALGPQLIAPVPIGHCLKVSSQAIPKCNARSLVR